MCIWMVHLYYSADFTEPAYFLFNLQEYLKQ